MLENKIYLGNCYQLMKEMDDKSIDLLLSDPPYEFISKNPVGGGFMDKENKKHLKKLNESFGMSFNPGLLLKESLRIMKKYNAYIFTNKTLLKDYIQFAEDNKFKWDLLIIAKKNPVPINNGHYLIDKEYCVFIHEGGATFNSDLGYGRYFTVKNVSIGNNLTSHPTEKPIEPIKDFIEISSNKGDLVFDPYLGSGTSLVAAKSLGRNYIGMEINENFYNMAVERINNCQMPLI